MGVAAAFLSTLSLRRATIASRYATGIERFLSTLSLRRATVDTLIFANPMLFLSTLSLRRATMFMEVSIYVSYISIHALLAESDMIREPTPIRDNKFLSTLSLRRATVNIRSHGNNGSYFYPRSPCGERPLPCLQVRRTCTISIHALLAESDLHYLIPNSGTLHFYPRSPCGERRAE